MSGRHPVYRWLIRLYPKAFRDRYTDELVQSFDDLVADRGARAAWRRVGGDVARTVPRYRFDATIGERRPRALGAAIALGVLILLSARVLVIGFLAAVVAVVVWLARQRQPSRAHRPLPIRRPVLYRPGIGLMVIGFALLAIFVLPYWFIGRSLAADIGAPPGYTRTSVEVRNPLSLALEHEPYLVVTSYVRDQPATEIEITQEITTWLAGRGFDQPGTVGGLQPLGRARVDQYGADLARFGLGGADGPPTTTDRHLDRLSITLDVADQDGLLLRRPVVWMLLVGSLLILLDWRLGHRRQPSAAPGVGCRQG